MSRLCEDEMAEDELREELANRLWTAAYQHGDPVPQDDSGEQMKMISWRRLADECIHQMEWARHECGEQVPDREKRAQEGPAVSTAMKYEPLTPAPQGWRP